MIEKIKFITFTDTHISDSNPGSRVGNYRDDILNKLKQIGLVGHKLQVDFFLNGGDLYHFKPPMKNSHYLNFLLTRLFKSFPAPIYSTEGNHDLRYDSYDNINEQPLNILYENKILIQARHIVKNIKGLKIRIRSFPFNEEPDLNDYAKSNKKDEDADLKICILHLYSSPEGGMLFKHKLYSYDEISVLNDDIFLLGHYHVDQGIKLVNNKYFINVGAISRGSLSEDNISRIPKFGLVSVYKDNGKIKIEANAVKLKVKSVEEIFNVEAKKEEKKKIEEAEIFVNKLKDEMTNISDNKDKIDTEIDKIKLDKEVLDKVRYYLSEAMQQ